MVIDNQGNGPRFAVVQESASLWTFNTIDLRRQGNVAFRNPADSITIASNSGILGDFSSQLCAAGTIVATALTTITNIGLCIYKDGLLSLRTPVTINQVTVSVFGNLLASDVTVTNGGILELSGMNFLSNFT